MIPITKEEQKIEDGWMYHQRGHLFCTYGWIVLVLLGGWSFVGVLSCGTGCKTALDCAAGKVCLLGSCQVRPEAAPGQEIVGGLENPTVGKDGGPEVPSSDDPSPDLSEQPPQGENATDTDAGSVETVPELPLGPKVGDLVINEVLFDPPAGNDGDANRDGVRDSSQDEFVEIVNLSKASFHVGGVTLEVDGKKYVFPEGAIVPGDTAVVVFGGGLLQDPEVNTGKPHSQFGGALVYTKVASGSLPSLTNKAATLRLLNKEGDVLDTFAYGTADCPGGDNVDQSVTRNPDGTGKCTLHSKAAPGAKIYSPGTRIDGTKFTDALPEPPPAEQSPEDATEPPAEGPVDGGETVADASGEETEPGVTDGEPGETVAEVETGQTPVLGDLVINEVLATPDATLGDANKDGTPSIFDDEFVEIVNKSTNTLQMKGVEVYVNTSDIFVFPSVLLKPKQAAVIFRGGMASDTEVDKGLPHSKFGGALVYRMAKKIALTNTGATIEIKLGGVSLDTFIYGSATCKGDQNQSVTRSPELTPGTCVLHKQADPNQSLFSPGTQANGQPF